MTRLRLPLLLIARVLNALFFLTTAVYAILTYSPFAYEQFIQPNMIAWLSNFVFLHADFFWLSLCLTLLTLAPHLKSSRVRVLAWTYLIAAAITGVVVTAVPVMPSGNSPVRSVAVALAALIPIAWLGAIDHLSADSPRRRVPDFGRGALGAALAAALVVWAAFAIESPMRLRAAGGVDATVATQLVGAGASFAAHLTAFTIAFLALASSRAARVAPAFMVSIAAGAVLHEVVLAPISVTGIVSWVLSLAIAAAFVTLISGLARQLAPVESRRGPIVALALVPVAAFGVVPALTAFDWGFMLQKLAALGAACVAYAATQALWRARRNETLQGAATMAVPLVVAVMLVHITVAMIVPRLAMWFGDARLRADFALDAYSAADPSYRVLRQFLETDRAEPDDAAFYAYLRANSSLKETVRPVSVDFVRETRPLPARPPDIFLFIIDSLRRDYLSAYNSRVTFTPRLGEFARDSDVFTRVFSRYGGTGLAVPSIWAGALVVHKQYVTPFAPMNALAKLLDADDYRRVVTRDHITEELFGLDDGTSVLDYRVPEMQHTFCGTMSELKDELRAHGSDPRPIFAHTRPLDLHIGNTRFAAVPPGESYPGFFEPYAARVHAIDTCFGEFLDELKRVGRYESSIIVVMSDHGDSLGEGLRWGHGYAIVPEVLRIPLLIRVPTALRAQFAADVTRLAFATDVTPSLYALTGRTPTRPRAAAGVSLYASADADIPSRRHDAFLVASSYGAVYGILAHNGRRLYIADGIEGRDSMYDLSPAGADERIGMTDAERRANRARIREQIADLSAWYGISQSGRP